MKRGRIIMTFDGGGLCNRIFPFANALAFGWQNGMDVVNPVFYEYREWFQGTSLSGNLPQARSRSRVMMKSPGWQIRCRIAKRIVPHRWHQVPETARLDLPGILDDGVTGTHWVQGLYLLADEAFVRESDRLREFFSPSASWSQVIAAEMQSVREGAECVVGVHIRHGDYRHHDGGRLFVPVDMHRRMMQELETQMSPRRVRFLICSDEAKDKSVFQGLDICFGNGHPLVDLYMLAACDRIMGPPSTYSQWASFYGKAPRLTYWVGMSNNDSHALKTDFITHAKGFGRYI